MRPLLAMLLVVVTWCLASQARGVEITDAKNSIFWDDSIPVGQIQGVLVHFNYGGNGLYTNASWRSFAKTRKWAMVLMVSQDTLTDPNNQNFSAAATAGLGFLKATLDGAATASGHTELAAAGIPYVFTGISRGGTLGALNHGWSAGANKTLAVIAFHGNSLLNSGYSFPSYSSVQAAADAIPVLYKIAQNDSLPVRQTDIESEIRQFTFRPLGGPWTSSMDYGAGHSSTGVSDTYTLQWLGRVIDARFNAATPGTLKTTAVVSGGSTGMNYTMTSGASGNCHFTSAAPVASFVKKSSHIWIPPGGQAEWLTENITPTTPRISAIACTPSTTALQTSVTASVTATDPFAETLSFAWSVQSKPTSGNVTFGTATAASTSAVFTGQGGTYVLKATVTNAIAQQIATNTVTVTVADAAPTVATAAAATPSPVTGTTTALSVLGADDGGEAGLTYTWATTGTPPAAVTFSANGSNAAKATTATFTKAGSYNFVVTIRDLNSQTVTSPVAVTVVPTTTTVTVTPATVSLANNGAQTFTGSALDQFGTALTVQPTLTWALAPGGLGSVNAGGTYTAPASGTGAATVRATSGAVTGTAAVTVTNTAPTVATAASATPSPVTGTTTALSVLGADDGGEAALTYTWATTGTPPAAVTFSANASNAAKATTATFTKAGSYSFLVTIRDANNLTVTSPVAVTVAQTATAVTVSPATATLANNGTQTFAATTLDQFGTVLGVQPAITFSLAPGSLGSVNAGGTYTAPASGTGSATVRATTGAITGTATVAIGNTPPTVATAAAATPSPVTGTTTALSVLGADDGGEAALTYTWTTTGTPPAAVTFSANGSNAAKTTTATFTKAGTYTFQVTIRDTNTLTVTSSVAVTVVQTATTVTVSPATVSLADNATQTFTASTLDQFGTVLAVQPTVTFTVAPGGLGSVNAGGTYTAPASGTGSATVRATTGGITGTAVVTVTNAAPTVATAAAASPSPVTGTTTALSVLGADDGGEAGLTYTWATTGTPPAAVTFSANGSNAAKATTATFTTAGSYNLQVTIRDPNTLTVTSPLAVTVVQTATTVTVSPATVSLANNAPQTFTASTLDQFGAALAVQPTVTFALAPGGLGSVNAGGTYTAPASGTGSATVRATTGAITGTAAVTVTNAAPTMATAAAATPSPVTGTTTALSVLGADDGGEASLTYTWATTGTPPAAVTFSANGSNAAKATTATFTKAGSYNLLVTIRDANALTVTSPVTVTVAQTATAVTVTPATVSLANNVAQTFTASTLDQFGTALAVQPAVTFSLAPGGLGSVNAGGTYTAPVSGTGSATVRATAGAITGTASVTIGNTAPTVATAASATPSPVTGTTTALSVLGADDGGEAGLTYTWATTGTPPAAVTFSANASNAAKATTATFTKAGSYNFLVTIRDANALTVTSPVAVTVAQTATSVTVSPATASVANSAAQTFTASTLDQFGTALAVQPAVTFTLAPGDLGSVDAGGTYTAPASGTGAATVRATTGAITGTAAVTILDAAPSVATPAQAGTNPVTGTTTVLSVLGASAAGESTLVYSWATTGTPPGPVTFSDNDRNAAKTVTATFVESGTYDLVVTILEPGHPPVTSPLTVTVSSIPTTLSVAPTEARVGPSGVRQFRAVVQDQFGYDLDISPGWTVAGGGTCSTSGLFTAGPTPGGPFALTATFGSLQAQAQVTVDLAALPVATLTATQPRCLEDGSQAGAFQVSLGAPAVAPVTVAYAVSGTATDGADYQHLSGQVTIAAGSSTAAIPVVALPDNRYEGDETVVVDLVAGAGYQVGSPARATVTVVEDDALALTPTPTLETPATPQVGVTLTFTGPANVDRPETVRSTWTWGDGTTTVDVPGLSADHVFPTTGTFTVTVTVTDPANGQTSTRNFTVTVAAAGAGTPPGSGGAGASGGGGGGGGCGAGAGVAVVLGLLLGLRRQRWFVRGPSRG